MVAAVALTGAAASDAASDAAYSMHNNDSISNSAASMNTSTSFHSTTASTSSSEPSDGRQHQQHQQRAAASDWLNGAKTATAGGIAGAFAKSCTAPLARLTILYQVRCCCLLRAPPDQGFGMQTAVHACTTIAPVHAVYSLLQLAVSLLPGVPWMAGAGLFRLTITSSRTSSRTNSRRHSSSRAARVAAGLHAGVYCETLLADVMENPRGSFGSIRTQCMRGPAQPTRVRLHDLTRVFAGTTPHTSNRSRGGCRCCYAVAQNRKLCVCMQRQQRPVVIHASADSTHHATHHSFPPSHADCVSLWLSGCLSVCHVWRGRSCGERAPLPCGRETW